LIEDILAWQCYVRIFLSKKLKNNQIIVDIEGRERYAVFGPRNGQNTEDKKMTELENKILEALKSKKTDLAKYDADRKAEYDEYMAKAAIQTSDYWKKDCERSAEWALHFQHHGYDFIEAWKNVIAKAMYGRIYQEWHSAQAGRYRGTGHGAYTTSELTYEEQGKVGKVFDGLVRQGYLKVSKSGKQATFTK
jgi:hypothetical protein